MCPTPLSCPGDDNSTVDCLTCRQTSHSVCNRRHSYMTAHSICIYVIAPNVLHHIIHVSLSYSTFCLHSTEFMYCVRFNCSRCWSKRTSHSFSLWHQNPESATAVWSGHNPYSSLMNEEVLCTPYSSSFSNPVSSGSCSNYQANPSHMG